MTTVSDKVINLYEEAPTLFDLKRVDDTILDDFIVTSGDIGNVSQVQPLGSSPSDEAVSPGYLPAGVPERLPKYWRIKKRKDGFPPPPDSLGFYFPFHYTIAYWGIYLMVEPMEALVDFLSKKAPSVSREDVQSSAYLFVYYHEAYHHKIEMFATRFEVFSRRPVFKSVVETIYQQGKNQDKCIEETCANVHALAKTRALIKTKLPHLNSSQRQELDITLLTYIKGQPKAYADAADYFLELTTKSEPIVEFEDVEHGLFEEIQQTHMGGDHWALNTWKIGSYLSTPDNRCNGRVNYLYSKFRPLTQFRGRFLSTNQIIKKIEKTIGEKLVFVRNTKGSHRLYTTSKGFKAVFPKDNNMPIGTLNSIIKELKLGMSVHELLRQ